MAYVLEVHPQCQEEIDKLSRKNPVLGKAVRNKMAEIIEYPQHYKPLKYNLAGERRVHILKSFVLKFLIDEERKVVQFLSLRHHDDAYRR